MSILPFVSFGFLLAGFLSQSLCVYYLRKENRALRNGQHQWKAVAEHRTAQSRAFEDQWQALRDEETRLIVHVWGEPALNRNLRDVVGFVDEFRRELAVLHAQRDAAARYIIAVNEKRLEVEARLTSVTAELKERNGELADAQTALQSMQEQVFLKKAAAGEIL